MSQLYLSNNLINGSLPSVWQGLGELSQLYLSNNTILGPLPSVWQGVDNLSQLYLSNNQINGSLPSLWHGLDSLSELYLSNNLLTVSIPGMPLQGLPKLRVLDLVNISQFNLDQTSLLGTWWSDWGRLVELRFNWANQSGSKYKADYSWRQLCRRKVLTKITWCVGSDNFCVPPTGLATLNASDTSFNTDWRSNACIYPGSREVLFAGMALGGFIIFCMMLTILLYSVYGKPNIEGVQAGGCIRVLFLGIALAKPVMCVVDIVTDALTIAQVWPSSPAYALLGAVFIPNLMVSIAVTVAMMYQCGRLVDGAERASGSRVHGGAGTSPTADSPAATSPVFSHGTMHCKDAARMALLGHPHRKIQWNSKG